MQNGVVFVGVALRAVKCEPHPRRARDPDAVDHRVEAVFLRVDAALLVEHGVSVKTGGDFVGGGGVREEVARELADAELVEGHVRVEGFDDPVAVGPDGAGTVFFVAVGVGVAREIQPAPGPALSVVL